MCFRSLLECLLVRLSGTLLGENPGLLSLWGVCYELSPQLVPLLSVLLCLAVSCLSRLEVSCALSVLRSVVVYEHGNVRLPVGATRGRVVRLEVVLTVRRRFSARCRF